MPKARRVTAAVGAPVLVAPGFGSRLKESRERADLSQVELAAACGVDPITVSRCERSVAQPKPESVAAYCRVLRVTEDYLVRGIGGVNPHAELIEDYLGSKRGKTTAHAIADRLRAFRFADLGISVPTQDAVHDVRCLLDRYATDR